MQEILVMTSRTSARPPVETLGVEVGRQESPWDGSVRAIFLAEKSRSSVAFGNPRFSGKKSY